MFSTDELKKNSLDNINFQEYHKIRKLKSERQTLSSLIIINLRLKVN